MIKKIILSVIILTAAIFCKNFVLAADNLAEKLSGRILLQTEQNGEAWYLSPLDLKKYYLKRPDNAFAIMQKLGIGIKNTDLEKIPIGILNRGTDSDGDGLNDVLESTIGTDIDLADSDGDGYSDKDEIENYYNPLGKGIIKIDKNFTKKNLGRIFLQIENKGEAWYLDPISEKRYYLARPSDALSIMRRFSLGITNADLNKIQTNQVNVYNPITTQIYYPPTCTDCNNNDNADSVLSGAASAIRANDKEKAASYFIPEMKKAIEYTMDFLDADGRLTLGNILSGSTLSDATETKKTYSNEVYFSLGGYKVPLKFYIEKQSDGKWLLSNL